MGSPTERERAGFVQIEGSPTSPVILHVPHASKTIPAEVRRRIVATDRQLEAELAEITDTGTDRLAAVAAGIAARRPWQFVNALSRLVVDPERFLDEREELNAVGRGAVYTRRCDGEPLRDERTWSAADTQALVDEVFRPYADAMTDLTRARLEACGRAVVVDVHSYPARPSAYEQHAEGPRPEVCLGTDAQHTPPELVAAARAAFDEAGFEVGLNSPFAGCYIPLPLLGDVRVSALMVEIRKDVYLADPARQAALGTAVAAVVDYANTG
ncbi:MAG: N-formylglutamate amidohydrolase [Gordonia sp. (in: high G+C Gram-positive bacteria)]